MPITADSSASISITPGTIPTFNRAKSHQPAQRDVILSNKVSSFAALRISSLHQDASLLLSGTTNARQVKASGVVSDRVSDRALGQALGQASDRVSDSASA